MNEKIKASLLVGVLGAILGAIQGCSARFEGIDYGAGDFYAGYTIPVGIIAGFLICFGLSVVYLFFVREPENRNGLLYGLAFGAACGALCGIALGVTLGIIDSRSSDSKYLFYPIVGAIPGLIAGAFLNLMFGSDFNKPPDRKDTST
jgi:hypothetical protein